MIEETLGITTTDLAAVLHMPSRTVRSWALREQWRHVDSNGRRYYHKDDVMQSARVLGRLKEQHP